MHSPGLNRPSQVPHGRMVVTIYSRSLLILASPLSQQRVISTCGSQHCPFCRGTDGVPGISQSVSTGMMGHFWGTVWLYPWLYGSYAHSVLSRIVSYICITSRVLSVPSDFCHQKASFACPSHLSMVPSIRGQGQIQHYPS